MNLKLFTLYLAAARQATQTLGKNWLILPAAVLLFLAFAFSLQLFAGWGLVGGFILGALQLVTLTYFYSWIAESCDRRTPLPLSGYLVFQRQLFFDILSIAFLLFIVQWLVDSLLLGLAGTTWIKACVNTTILVLCNPIPETLYQKRLPGLAGLQYAFGFASNYFIEWFLPLLALLAPLLFWISPAQLLARFISTEVLLPPAVIATAWQAAGMAAAAELVFTLTGLVLGIWYMFFRSFLFQSLDTHSFRR